jgi:choline dehydrogenase
MTYLRGVAADYDKWSFDGCTGWNWESVLPHFKALESTVNGDDNYRGRNGPQHLQTARGIAHELSLACIEAAKQAGIELTDDVNGSNPVGVGYQDIAIKDGRRFGPAEAFLYPSLETGKVTVLSGTRVLRLNFNATGTCVSLLIRHNGETSTIPVESELVLAAGTIDTPRLLLLSGIGPGKDLSLLGTKTLLDHRGVGQNLHDHILIGGVVCETKQPVAPMTTNTSEVIITAQRRPGSRGPDIGIPFFQGGYAAGPHRPKVPQNSYTLIPGILHPLARGELRLAKADPDIPPLINPNYLGETADMELVLESIALAREVVNAPAFASFRKSEVLPGPGKSRAQTIDFLKQGLGSWYHPVGTCRMGTDDSAPVDPQSLRLKGTRNVRIADCSIIPTIPSANTMAAAMLVAEKASDIILRMPKQ